MESFSEEAKKGQAYFHPSEQEVLISAHRGGVDIKGYPENCLETMQYLYGKGITLFEIDIMETSDGALMLLHDSHLERTTTGTGGLVGLNSDQLRQLYLVDDFGNKTDFRIPFFKDVLVWGKKDNAYFMLDFKKEVSYQKVINMVRDEQMNFNVCLIAYSTEQAEKLHKLAPEMMISVSTRNERELDWILKTDIPKDKMVAFTGTRLSKESLYDSIRSLGIPVNLGTLGNLDNRAKANGDALYKKWNEMGVNVFSTDRPLEVLKVFNHE